MNNQTKTLTSMISSSADFRFKLQKELQYSNHASEWEIFPLTDTLMFFNIMEWNLRTGKNWLVRDKGSEY